MTTQRSTLPPTGSDKHFRRLTLVAALVATLSATNVLAQAPSAPGSSISAPSAATLEGLVGRIALYPDDLVAIILPASTNPLQLVQADRFLEKRKTDPKLPIDARWDDPVKTLCNYPDVVKMMSGDLDWTTALGEAVVTDQGAVLEAIQTFRRKTQSVGNLKSDEKQVIIVEKEVIKIVPADPQVIYVPQYNPSTVIVSGGYPSYGYYPAPYPVYSYPYPPGAALATGLIWGAAIGAAWSGNHYGAHYGGGGNTINVNNSTNISGGGNVNTGGNVNRPGTPSQRPAGGGSGSSQWKPNKQPGQVGRTPSAGVGDSRPGGSGNMGARPSTQPGGGGGAFSGNSSGRQTQMDSSRGASSRNAMSNAGSRQSPSANTRQAPSGARSGGGGGGGARSSGGGGGARSGGGGGGGGRGGGGGGRR
jgi:hypothetical protein